MGQARRERRPARSAFPIPIRSIRVIRGFQPSFPSSLSPVLCGENRRHRANQKNLTILTRFFAQIAIYK